MIIIIVTICLKKKCFYYEFKLNMLLKTQSLFFQSCWSLWGLRATARIGSEKLTFAISLTSEEVARATCALEAAVSVQTGVLTYTRQVCLAFIYVCKQTNGKFALSSMQSYSLACKIF